MVRMLNVIALAAAAVLVSGCASPARDSCAGIAPKHLPSGDCNPGRCTVAIHVNRCAANGIESRPAVLRVTAANNMVFEIATPGYRFSGEGIHLPSDTKSRFVRRSSTPTRIEIHNDRGARECVKYDVEVVPDERPTPCPRYDPYIANQ
jgi:hypothetical protein